MIVCQGDEFYPLLPLSDYFLISVSEQAVPHVEDADGFGCH